jgi:hypothetical protein
LGIGRRSVVAIDVGLFADFSLCSIRRIVHFWAAIIPDGSTTAALRSGLDLNLVVVQVVLNGIDPTLVVLGVFVFDERIDSVKILVQGFDPRNIWILFVHLGCPGGKMGIVLMIFRQVKILGLGQTDPQAKTKSNTMLHEPKIGKRA